MCVGRKKKRKRFTNRNYIRRRNVALAYNGKSLGLHVRRIAPSVCLGMPFGADRRRAIFRLGDPKGSLNDRQPYAVGAFNYCINLKA